MTSNTPSITYSTEKNFYLCDCTKAVTYNDTLVFAEFYGLQGDGDYIAKQFKSRRTSDDRLFYYGKKIKTESKMKIQKMTITKRRVAYLATGEEAFGQNPRVFIGSNVLGAKKSFYNWLLHCQPIPYPRDPKLYKNTLGMLAEEFIFNEMMIEGLIQEIKTHGDVVAYGLTDSYSMMSDVMKKIVLKCVKNAGLLEVDRIKKYLSENSPSIGASVNNEAVVHTVMLNNSSNITYYVIEYDKSSEEVFCLVDNNGSIEWEQFAFQELFNNVNNIVSKKKEHKNIKIDNSGNISNNVSNVA